MSLEQFKTQVLLLHSEQRTLDLFSKGFNDNYSVHCATSGTEALNALGDTPIDVLICAQKMPGMSGLEALREAKKRSPDMIGILLAGSDTSDGLEAMVGEQEVFQIIRGEVKPDSLQDLVEAATKRLRLMTISRSANDTKANVDEPTGEHIVMETAENGASIISDGTGTMPALKPDRIQITPNTRGREIDILVLTKDEEFLATIKESSMGLHDVYHADTPTQAEDIVVKHKVGVLVTDAAMVGSNIEVLTQKLRKTVPRLVAVVAGRRDDGELLMDLINRGQVYRFLLKPVSPGRVRLAIEASVKHHLDAADSAFKGKPKTAASPIVKPASAAPPKKATPAIRPATKNKKRAPVINNPMPELPESKPQVQKIDPMHALVKTTPAPGSPGLESAFDEVGNFGETVKNIAASVGKAVAAATGFIFKSGFSIIKTSGKAALGFMRLAKNPKVLAGATGLAVILAATMWFLTTESNEVIEPEAIVQDQVTTPVPPVTGTDSGTSTEPAPQTADPASLRPNYLQMARDARAAGDIASPAGRNAMEFYIAALSATPGDEAIAAELSTLTEEVFGLAENHLLANRNVEAARALRVIGLVDPEIQRLRFMNVQLEKQQLRELLDETRIATSNSQFEDASRFLTEAALLAGSNTTELNALAEQLTAARIEKYGSLELADEARVAAEQAAADRVAAEAAALRQAEEDRVAAAAAEKAETDRIAAEAAAAKQAEEDRIAAEAAATKQAEEERIAAEAAATKQAEEDRVAAEAAAAKKAEDDRIAAEAAAAKKAEDDRIAAEAAAAKKAEDDRIAAEAAAAKKAEDDRIAAEAAAAIKAEDDRIAAEAAAAKKAEDDRIAAEAAAAIKAEDDRIAAEAAAAKKAEEDRIVAQAENDRLAAAAAAATAAAAARQYVATESPTSSDGGENVAAASQSAATQSPTSSDGTENVAAAKTDSSPDSPAGSNETASPVDSGAVKTSAPEDITAVKRIHYVAPRYPRSAQRQDITGWVDLAFTVTTAGEVADIEIMASEPQTTFHAAATKALEQWRFEPATESGQPVEKRIALRMSFNLQ